MTRIAPAFALLLGFVACGGNSPPPETPMPNVPVPEKPFDQLSRNERLALMKNVVFPKMKAAFQATDPQRYQNFSCKTCHGEGAEDGTYKMPWGHLPKLDAKDGFKKHREATPVMAQFMMQTVAPQMATLLRLPPYDPATKKGFGCHNCHHVDE